MKRLCAYIKRNDPSSGFTLVSVLLSLTTLLLVLPFISIVILNTRGMAYENAIDVHHFFIFLRDDIIEAREINIQPNTLTLTLITGNRASYSLYGDVIRRRVQHQGHEVYTRNIRNLTFSEMNNRLRVKVTTTKGEQYEQDIQLYP